MTAIIDYDAGNIKSVTNALERLGADYVLTGDPEVIISADRVLLPGVGNDAEAMAKINERGLGPVIKSLRRPVLGICVGMQILCRDSEEGLKGQTGLTQCLGIFDSHVRRFPDSADAKVPHIGWNQIGNMDSKLLRGIEKGADVYFVHSYYAGLCPDTIATCRHGNTIFSAALKYENFYGTQFHPEKSGGTGEQILRNFLAL